MSVNYVALGKRISYFRMQCGNITQEALASKINRSREFLAKIEKGEVDLAESKIREFAKALKVSPQELMGWDEPDEPITIAAHFDGDEYTADELDRIKEYAAFIKATRR